MQISSWFLQLWQHQDGLQGWIRGRCRCHQVSGHVEFCLWPMPPGYRRPCCNASLECRPLIIYRYSSTNFLKNLIEVLKRFFTSFRPAIPKQNLKGFTKGIRAYAVLLKLFKSHNFITLNTLQNRDKPFDWSPIHLLNVTN